MGTRVYSGDHRSKNAGTVEHRISTRSIKSLLFERLTGILNDSQRLLIGSLLFWPGFPLCLRVFLLCLSFSISFRPFLRDNRKDILIWFLASALIMVLSISAAKSISTKRTTIRVDKDFLKKYRESEKRLSNESYLNNLLGLDADNFSFFDNIK